MCHVTCNSSCVIPGCCLLLTEDFAKMSEPEITRKLLASPALLNAPTRGVESEPDTDEEMTDATDLED